MDMWSSGDKPFFITEFYAKAEDSGLTNESGAGWLVQTQDDRAKFFENFVLALTGHPGCVGYHHFRYQDEVDSNKGLINLSFQWYEPLKNSFWKVARNVYALRQFLLDQSTGAVVPLRNSSIRIYPNPTGGKIQITGGDQSQPVCFEVFSSSGVRISQAENAGLPCEMYLGNHTPGIYIVKVSQNGNAEYQQVILTN
jgi:hypothetical protein